MAEPDIFEEKPDFVCFRRHENGVHEFTFFDVSQAAVDHFFAMMSAWIKQRDAEGVTPSDTLYLMIDFRSAGTPNMKYIYQCAANLRQRYPHILRPRTRCATLLRDGFLVEMAQAFNNLLTNGTRDQLRTFSGDKAHEQAVAWLLRDT